MGKYDDAKFGVIQRRWIGGSYKLGLGGSAIALTTAIGNGTTDATSGTLAERIYFKGPIQVKKFGAICVATSTNASNDLVPCYLKTRGASASAAGTIYLKSTSTAVSPYTIASTQSFTVSKCKVGEYLSIRFGTPRTDKGTSANTATTTGSWALFIDYVPTFATEWDDPT
jgi:hypothetical protein